MGHAESIATLNPTATTVSLAVIGCGAAAEKMHLPALQALDAGPEELVLVDRDEERARALADRFGATVVASEFQPILHRVDGAIVATPPESHPAITRECVRKGVPVLCEKPLAQSVDEAKECIAAAEEEDTQIEVNHVRRLYPSSRKVKEFLESGALGEPVELTFTLGEIYDWPTATGSTFRTGADRGILQDLGPHVLDLVSWWLGGDVEVREYQDDSRGGSEAVAQVRLHRGNCEGRIRLSWLSELDNGFLIRGEKGRLEGGVYELNRLRITNDGGSSRDLRLSTGIRSESDCLGLLLENFLSIAAGRGGPLIPAHEILPSIRVIEAAYRQRQTFDMPWFGFAGPHH